VRLGPRDDDLGFRSRYVPPVRVGKKGYLAAQATFVADMLDRPDIVARFRSCQRLPRDYGIGLDERVVEYPWLVSQGLKGRVLDAGSILNHEHILERVLEQLDALHVVTLAPERRAFVKRGISYLFADLRDLPIRDDYYDVVASLSTLEHVGMDNSHYGDATARAADPRAAVSAAVHELRRVLRPGGRLLITVPYGRSEDHGWFRQFDRDDVRLLLDAIDAKNPVVTVYAYSPSGWQLSGLRSAARLAYADRAPAARSVVCIAAAPTPGSSKC
jgi:SAM-dependent methyltransferase